MIGDYMLDEPSPPALPCIACAAPCEDDLCDGCAEEADALLEAWERMRDLERVEAEAA
jgi:predicted Fe-S protein YdhL (DUF1289 family)